MIEQFKIATIASPSAIIVYFLGVGWGECTWSHLANTPWQGGGVGQPLARLIGGGLHLFLHNRGFLSWK